MLITTMKELNNFIFFFLASITYFAFAFHSLDAEFDDNDYKDLPVFMVIVIQSFRNSIGDIDTPKYS